MRLTNRLAAGLVAVLAAFAFIAPAAAQETGGIKGTFVLKGEVPKLDPPKIDKDPQVCAAQPVPNEMLILDPGTKGVANVFVWIAKVDEKKIPAALQKPAQDQVTIDNKNCRFVPHAFVARTGQTMVLLNSDPVGHNVHTFPLRGKAINDLVAPNDKVGIKRPVEKAEILPTQVKCDIHPWMIGYMLVLDHPYGAVSDEKGAFTIEGLPPGKYDLKVWHEAGGYVGFTAKGITGIEVAAGETTDLGKKEIDVKDMKNLKP